MPETKDASLAEWVDYAQERLDGLMRLLDDDGQTRARSLAVEVHATLVGLRGNFVDDADTRSSSAVAKSYSALSDEDLTILHAAMTAMTQGIHACQSNLSDQQWERAEEIWDELDDEINSRAL